jgi:hypothetical protein
LVIYLYCLNTPHNINNRQNRSTIELGKEKRDHTDQRIYYRIEILREASTEEEGEEGLRIYYRIEGNAHNRGSVKKG